MTSNRKIITVRVDDNVKQAFEHLCSQQKRSMSKQGEMLVEAFIKRTAGLVIVDEAAGLPDDIWDRLNSIYEQTS